MNEREMYDRVVQANIALHDRMAASYRACEPHFRPENVANVLRKLRAVADAAGRRRMLDLGCGTGFMIEIGRAIFEEIHGVDVSEKMLEQVDRRGPARVLVTLADSGRFPVEEGSYDVVTSYSFLHHLYDCGPTLKTAARALKPGGRMYVDLEPNYDFWAAVSTLERHGTYDPIVTREIEMVTYKDEDIEQQFGVSADVFNHAEYGKSMLGGFGADYLRAKLADAGFEQVEFFYEWFIGQGQMINDEALPREQRFANATVVHDHLQRLLPLSRSLFKYIGFVAMK
jgi:ubiquinone/menaquinone biosynthesis C-methylase UbiE